MISSEHVQSLVGAPVHDRDGDKIGTVDQVYLDDQTGDPAWVTVATGWFGTSRSFAPVSGAQLEDNAVRLAHTKEEVKGAPRIEADGHLDEPEQDELYAYYHGRSQGVGDHDDRAALGGRLDAGTRRTDGVAEATGETEMTLSEERLRVGTESVEAGRVRLRKYVTTEHQTVTVPVRKEKLEITRERLDDGRPSATGIADEGEVVEEVVLREERPVVAKETVDVERVALGKSEVVEEHTVTEQVRKEQVDIEGDADELK